MNVNTYPRGFLGIACYPQTKNLRAEEFINSVRGVASNRNYTPVKNNLQSSPEVDQLWAEHLAGTGKTSSFDFRERLLICATKVFGSNFLVWAELQNSNPFMTALHKNFMNDTMEFISKGKRSVNVTTWMSLVGISENVKPSPATRIMTKEFFQLDMLPHMRRKSAIEEVLIAWTSQPSGFDDLLSTIVIIFGNTD